MFIDLLQNAINEFAGIFKRADGLFGAAEPVAVSRHHCLKVLHVGDMFVQLVLVQDTINHALPT